MTALGAGLTFLGLAIPTIFVPPIAGWACDRWGAEIVAVVGIAFSTAVYPLLLIRGPIPLFVFSLALQGDL